MHHPDGGNKESTDCARMPWEQAVIAAKACALSKQGRKQPIEQEASGYVQENAAGPADNDPKMSRERDSDGTLRGPRAGFL